MYIIENEKIICKNPKASIIILAYNEQDTIQQCIESFLHQECEFEYEIIVADDASSDNTLEICKKFQNLYPHIIRLVVQKKNGGVMNNYYSALLASRGDFVLGCGGDDFCHNKYRLREQIGFMLQHPKCGVVHADYDLLIDDVDLTKSYNATNKISVSDTYSQDDIYKGKAQVVTPTCCWRKSVLDNYFPAKKMVELRSPIEDWPMLMYVSAYSEVNYMPISVITYRRGHESLSNLKSYEKMYSKFMSEKNMYMYITKEFGLGGTSEGYDAYMWHCLLSLAYRKRDFKMAKQYAKMLHVNSMKVRFSRYKILFYAFCLFKKLKR